MKVNFLGSVLLQIFLGAVLLAANANVGAAQDYTAQVRRQLDAMRTALEDRGYKETHDRRIGRLNASAVESVSITLREGWEYVFYGVCDNDCSDLDIIVYDSNNNKIAEDVTDDDRPVTRINVNRTGTFRIQVRMYQCRVNPCVYGVGAAGK